jgi:peptidyl-tRNA hydrolase
VIPQADYVLGRFTDDQKPLAEEGIEDACKAVQLWCREGLAATMNQFNRKVIATTGDTSANQS